MTEREDFNRKNPDLPTYQDLYLMTFELASKFGTPYYDNRLPEYRGTGKGISCYQCCAYQFSAVADEDSDFDKKLVFDEGKHFSMGSWQVVSVNCPRAAYNAEGDDDRLFAELKRLMDVAVEIFKIKRRWMDLIRANGRMPFAMQRPKDPNTANGGPLPWISKDWCTRSVSWVLTRWCSIIPVSSCMNQKQHSGLPSGR